MERQAPAVESTQSLPVCQHLYPKGRHCRQAVLHPSSPYCAVHAPKYRPPAILPNPARKLAAKIKHVESAADVTAFLAGLLNLLADNLISARRAAVLTYIANSLVQSLRAEQREAQILENAPPKVDFSGLPRPGRDPQEESPKQLPSTPEEAISSWIARRS